LARIVVLPDARFHKSRSDDDNRPAFEGRAEGPNTDTPAGTFIHLAMNLITAFKPIGRRKQRILVLLDGRPWEELDAETIVRQRLSVGLTLDAAARQRVLAADRLVRARKAAASYLARGPRTRLELETYLQRRGYDATAATGALAALADSGTFDETRAADATIRRRRRSGHGPRRIRAELLERGIAPEHATRQLANALEGVDLQPECDALARRAAARHRPLTDPANRRKLSQYLLRRGYEGDMVRRAIERLARATENDS
jgi:regulatory protein